MLFDTHCHLNLAEHFPDPDAAVEEARQAGVEKLCIVGIDLPTCKTALEIAERHEGTYAIVGIHPNSSADYRPETLAEVGEMLAHPKAVALGEIGLDFHWDFASREQQERALHEQLDLAAARNMPVVFHCRKAYAELLSILESRPIQPYLFHCFSGTAADAERALALGGMLGFDGPITYKNAHDTREIARATPKDRIVIETDAPYLTPVPHRGKPNKPAYLPFVNHGLAAALKIGSEECAELTTANARRFFRIG